MRKTNGRLLHSINLSLKMLCFSLFCIFFLSLCCGGNWILPSGTAAGSDCVLQSGGSYLSLSTHCCSSPSRNKLQSTVDTETREERCAHVQTHAHTHYDNMIFSALTNVYVFAHILDLPANSFSMQVWVCVSIYIELILLHLTKPTSVCMDSSHTCLWLKKATTK